MLAMLQRRVRGDEAFRLDSLRRAQQEQHLAELAGCLERIVPDLSDQYTSWSPTGEYFRTKLYGQHAFQVSMALRGLRCLDKPPGELTVADIGDSSGTHMRYLTTLLPGLRTVSINLDPVAVTKIRAKGLPALHCRAEEVAAQGIAPDLFVSFQTLEHLLDPLGFLRGLAVGTKVPGLVLTMPYRAVGRVALEYIRRGSSERAVAERTHIFEWSPADWRCLFRFTGWDVVADDIYYQYPRAIDPLSRWYLRRYWQRTDFEGFYGAVLQRDERWATAYTDWPAGLRPAAEGEQRG